MIEITLLVPHNNKHEIDIKEGPEFRIIISSKNHRTQSRLFVIETTEEEYAFLKLKYGSENVWKR